MKVLINNIEFELHPNIPFTYTDTIELYIISDSSDEIAEAVGDKATVVVPNEYVGTDLVLNYIRRSWDTGVSVCETVFRPIPVKEIVDKQGEDIEAMAQAITELAEIIGGDE